MSLFLYVKLLLFNEKADLPFDHVEFCFGVKVVLMGLQVPIVGEC